MSDTYHFGHWHQILNDVPQKTHKDFSGMPHESLQEALARGVKPKIIASNCREDYPYRKVRIDFKSEHKTHFVQYRGEQR